MQFGWVIKGSEQNHGGREIEDKTIKAYNYGVVFTYTFLHFSVDLPFGISLSIRPMHFVSVIVLVYWLL